MSFKRKLCIGLLALALSGCKNSIEMKTYANFEDKRDRETTLSIDPQSALVREDIFDPEYNTTTVRHYSGDSMFELIYFEGRLESNQVYKASGNELSLSH